MPRPPDFPGSATRGETVARERPDADTQYEDLRDERDDEDVRALERLGIPRGAPRFNAQGMNGRNCPICLRTGTLAGDRADKSPMTCTGCATRFILFLSSDTLYANTLVRVTPPAPAMPYTPPGVKS